MTDAPAKGSVGLLARLLERAEEWIYDLNARDHWLFGLYDRGNELWAGLVLRGVRRRAARIDAIVEGRDGAQARLRMLQPADRAAFIELLEGLSRFKYLPPHRLDATAAARALERRSYLPFGAFDGDQLVGYLLVRLFFPRRAVTGMWSLEVAHNKRFGSGSIATTAAFTRAEGFADYITVPLDNITSLKAAQRGGWEILRKNRRFYVLRHP